MRAVIWNETAWAISDALQEIGFTPKKLGLSEYDCTVGLDLDGRLHYSSDCYDEKAIEQMEELVVYA